jgi:GNAT superfamily N-acetyltransferase
MDISIRPLTENDLEEADRIFRLSFGTFLGLPEPMSFAGDADYVESRFHANSSAAYAAEINGNLVGSNFTTNWGSVGFFGPLTIHPEYWNQGIAQKLLEPTMNLFDKWNTKHAGLFTFANSPKHIGLYQKFDFWPRFLTAIMSKDITTGGNNNYKSNPKWTKFSELFDGNVLGNIKEEETKYLNVCRRLTYTIYGGLDLSVEILSADKQELGDTILLWQDDYYNNKDIDITPVGLAVCHYGPGSEAGSNTCYIKFGTVKPGPDAGNDFVRLLQACEAFAAEKGMKRLVAGVNTARYHAYSKMLSRGFRYDMIGIAMQRKNDSGYNRPDVYLIDDWR